MYLQRIFAVFKQVGFSCHVGRDGSKSKTEAIYFPAPCLNYEDADTSILRINGSEVPLTQKFNSWGVLYLKDDAEIDARIKGAQGAFQSIRKLLQCQDVKKVHKKTAYEGLVLSILLYGCESSETWSQPKSQLNRLQMFIIVV